MRATPCSLAPSVLALVAIATPSAHAAGEIIDRGAPRIVTISPDDEVPRPIPAVVEPGAEHDVVRAPASGNPFVLRFIGEEYAPTVGERLDPRLGEALSRLGSDARPAPLVYTYAIFARRITAARVAALEALGARNMGPHPHHALKLAVPPEALPTIANLDFIRWVGVPRPGQKAHPRLVSRFASGARRIPVWISVFEDDRGPASTWSTGAAPIVFDPGEAARPGPAAPDAARRWTSNGWQHEALAARGVDVGPFVPEIRAFQATLDVPTLERILDLDFVQFVEPDVELRPHHDRSMPLIGADAFRATWDGGAAQQAIVGVIDTGFDLGHSMLDHVAAVGWDESPNQTGLQNDICGHGTHVAGTVFGKPLASDAHLTGVAPGLGWSNQGRVRLAKALDWSAGAGKCLGPIANIQLAASRMRGDYFDGSATSGPPHVVNNSYGGDNPPYTGVEAQARFFDAEVHTHDQVYVFSAGNSGMAGPSTIGLPAVAKNVLTVGAVRDTKSLSGPLGEITPFSSLGPCADGRWKPNLVAPGQLVTSAKAGTFSEYVGNEGTSMSAPHVTGVVAQLVDHHPWLRYEPARVHGLLMATAIPRHDAVLAVASDPHLDTYGAGRVHASLAHATPSDTIVQQWGYDLGPSQSSFENFTVPAGTERLIVCMTYIEPEASPGAAVALNNDFDLFLDAAPFTSGNDTGDYFTHQSSIDNTELRMIDDPQPGKWRFKVYPTGATQTVKMSVTVRMVLGDTDPTPVIDLTANHAYRKPGESVTVTAHVSASENVLHSVWGNAVTIGVGGSGDITMIDNYKVLLDGIVVDLPTGFSPKDVMLGDIVNGETRTTKWTMSFQQEGTKTIELGASVENGWAAVKDVDIVVDGTPPATQLLTASAPLGTWTSDPSVTFSWAPAPDALSGLFGYDSAVTAGSPADPGTVWNLGPVTRTTKTLASSTTGWHFSLKAVDHAGNWDPTFQSVGPIFVDAVDPTLATGLLSTSHPVNVWSNVASFVAKWSAATDAHSGLAGYSVVLGGAGLVPDDVADVTSTSLTTPAGSSAGGQFLRLRSVDVAGNADAEFASLGPFLIDVDAPSAANGLTSLTHAPSVWSTQKEAKFQWTAATDPHSGLAGYAAAIDESASTAPSPVSVDPGATLWLGSLTSSAAGQYFHLRAQDVAGNWGPTAHVGPFLLDDVAPAGPTSLISTSHAVGALSNDPTLAVTWTPATDAHSGLAGYATAVDTQPTTVPSGALDVAPGATGVTTALPTPTATTSYWVHVRARDVAGHWGTTQHLGPFVIGVCSQAAVDVTYGAGKPGTTGVPQLVALAPPRLGHPTTVEIRNAFPGSFPFLVLGVQSISVPFDGGTLLATPNFLIQLPVPIQPDGTLPLTGLLPSNATACGVTLYHQVLIPDPGATGFYQLAMTPGLARTFGS